jgi:hypothetical protein
MGVSRVKLWADNDLVIKVNTEELLRLSAGWGRVKNAQTSSYPPVVHIMNDRGDYLQSCILRNLPIGIFAVWDSAAQCRPNFRFCREYCRFNRFFPTHTGIGRRLMGVDDATG